MPPFVTFLSDFGAGDQFAGVCHGVVNQVCPEATVIHIGHGIDPQAVSQGARVLAGAIPYMPVGVHMAVVDPGVGSERRAIVLRSGDGRLFVGPDNGLLVPAAEACGGIELALHVTNPDYMLDQVSRTFHGRDVFSPVAGHLASGVDPRTLGEEIDAATLVRPLVPGFEREGSAIVVTVQHVDRFGNIQLSAGAEQMVELFQAGSSVEIEAIDDRYLAICAETFADVGRGELVLFADSEGQLSIAINRGHAAELLEVAAGTSLRIDFQPTIDD